MVNETQGYGETTKVGCEIQRMCKISWTDDSVRVCNVINFKDRQQVIFLVRSQYIED